MATPTLPSRGLKRTTLHPYHIVDPSPWPFLVAFRAFFLVFGLSLYRHTFTLGVSLFTLGLIATVSTAVF
jgi:cytochrome c oxidase subunit 3